VEAQRRYDGGKALLNAMSIHQWGLREKNQRDRWLFPFGQRQAAAAGFTRENAVDEPRKPVGRYSYTAMESSFPQKIHFHHLYTYMPTGTCVYTYKFRTNAP
jgi:hypothetical protein